MVGFALKSPGRLLVLVVLAWGLFVTGVSAEKLLQDKVNRDPVKVDFGDVVEHNGINNHSDENPTLSIAVAAMISPKDTYTYYLDLLRLIGEMAGRNVTFIQKKTYSEVNALLKNRRIDVAFVCSGPYVTGKADFGMEILVVPVCRGERVYYSYFISDVNGGIETFEDFRGKTFAFTDPLSNTGTMVPTYVLAKRGETPKTFFKRTFFTHGHDISIEAVATHLADGAAVDSLIYDFFKGKNPGLINKTKIVEKSPPYGIPPVVVHPNMAHDLKEKLRYIFLTIHTTPRGKAALSGLHIDRFEKGDDRDYDSVRELQTFLVRASEKN